MEEVLFGGSGVGPRSVRVLPANQQRVVRPATVRCLVLRLLSLVASFAATASLAAGETLDGPANDLQQRYMQFSRNAFIAIERQEPFVYFKASRKFRLGADGGFSSDFKLRQGESFRLMDDDHGTDTFTIAAIRADGVLIRYVSEFDHRSFGKNKITRDTGEVFWPYFARSESQAAVYYRQGREQYGRGELAAALSSLTKSLELEGHADIYHLRGCLLRDLAASMDNRGSPADEQQAGSYREKALVDFTKALEITPNFVAARMDRGRLHEDLGRFEEALADYGAVEAYERRAHVYFKLKRYRESWDDVRRAQQVGPVSGDLLEKLRAVSAEAGR